MLEELFNIISNRIKSKCTFVNSVMMYQSQDLFQQDNKGFKPTVCFIAFQNLTYETLGSNDIQKCNLDISIKILVEEYTNNYFKALSQKTRIVKALQNFAPLQYSLVRTSETLDTNPNSLYLFDVIFSTSFYEDLSEDVELVGGTSGNSWNFGLELLTDSNFDGVYSDWSGTSGTNFTPLSA